MDDRHNSGNDNSGDYNSGDDNSGDWNSGGWNSGDWNSGDYNSGNRNSGHFNSGHWNSGNSNSGYFNSTRPDTIRVFNKDLSLGIWKSSVIPNWLHFNLNMATYKESAKAAWDKAFHKDRMLTYKLPNFDADIAQDIFGIDFKQYLIDNKETVNG
jgi:hypothetical protein